MFPLWPPWVLNDCYICLTTSSKKVIKSGMDMWRSALQPSQLTAENYNFLDWETLPTVTCVLVTARLDDYNFLYTKLSLNTPWKWTAHLQCSDTKRYKHTSECPCDTTIFQAVWLSICFQIDFQELVVTHKAFLWHRACLSVGSLVCNYFCPSDKI